MPDDQPRPPSSAVPRPLTPARLAQIDRASLYRTVLPLHDAEDPSAIPVVTTYRAFSAERESIRAMFSWYEAEIARLEALLASGTRGHHAEIDRQAGTAFDTDTDQRVDPFFMVR